MSLNSLISRSAPFAVFARDPLAAFTQDLDRLFAEGLSAPSPVSSFGAGLRLDVTENDKAVIVAAECPGVEEKDIELSFHDGILTIKGEKKNERDEKTETLHLVERSYGSFSRSIAVPAEVNSDKIDARFAKGVLTVTLPKKEKDVEKAKKIEIKSA